VPNVCIRRNAQELEAYEIQNRYLAGLGASRRALVTGWSGKCKDEGSGAVIEGPESTAHIHGPATETLGAV